MDEDGELFQRWCDGDQAAGNVLFQRHFSSVYCFLQHVVHAPEDAEELVPYGLYGAASSTRRPFKIDANKICPECGIHHAPSHLFCRQDGTELVTVN